MYVKTKYANSNPFSRSFFPRVSKLRKWVWERCYPPPPPHRWEKIPFHCISDKLFIKLATPQNTHVEEYQKMAAKRLKALVKDRNTGLLEKNNSSSL